MAPGQLRSRTAGARWSRSAAPSSSAAPHLLTEGPLAAPRSRSAPPQPQPPRGQGCARCPFARLAARAPALAPARRPAERAGRRARARPAARRSSAGDGQRLAPRAPARPGARCGSARAPHVLASCAANLAERGMAYGCCSGGGAAGSGTGAGVGKRTGARSRGRQGHAKVSHARGAATGIEQAVLSCVKLGAAARSGQRADRGGVQRPTAS